MARPSPSTSKVLGQIRQHLRRPQEGAVAFRRRIHSTCRRCASSPLFALGALSNSRESQFLSKRSGLGPIEHIPSLELLRSEANLHPTPVPPEHRTFPAERIDATARGQLASQGGNSGRNQQCADLLSSYSPKNWEEITKTDAVDIEKALSIGYTVLKQHAQEVERLNSCIDALRGTHESERVAWMRERSQLVKERTQGSAIVLLAIGIATAAVSWQVLRPGLRTRADMAFGGHMEKVNPLDKWRVRDAAIQRNSPAVTAVQSSSSEGSTDTIEWDRSRCKNMEALETVPQGRQAKTSRWRLFWA